MRKLSALEQEGRKDKYT